jgi:hypothetical protein
MLWAEIGGELSKDNKMMCKMRRIFCDDLFILMIKFLLEKINFMCCKTRINNHDCCMKFY